MKNYLLKLIVLTFAAALVTACSNSYESATPDITDRNDSLHYSFGYLQGANLANQGIDDIDMNNYVAGFMTAMDEADSSIINDGDMQALIQSYFQELQMRQMEERAAAADVNIEQGQAFLEENLQNSDVTETESGLQYRVLEEGDGPSPEATDRVRVHYEGSLINDEVFDSSYDRGEPVTFPLNQVIPGWTEGVQLMNVGSKYQFFIPADLAYGNNPPQGSIIEPGSVLIFEVELLEIVE